jgi:fructose-1,6-bisphosphatase/inositol monophosphatase family enzyme
MLSEAQLMGRRASDAESIASDAADLIRRMLREPMTVGTKGLETDPVTNIDTAMDEFIRHRIKTAFPHDLILSEESAPASFEEFMHHPAVWIVDPVDGTANLSHRHEEFYVSIAFVSEGQTQIAAVAKPIGDKIWLATREGGFQKIAPNEYQRSVSQVEKPQHSVVGLTGGPRRRPSGHRTPFWEDSFPTSGLFVPPAPSWVRSSMWHSADPKDSLLRASNRGMWPLRRCS